MPSDLKDQVFLKIAVDLGALGTCDRGKVGALITRDGRCISWGYNGAPPGLPHCDENYHGYGHSWGLESAIDRGEGCLNSIHAEANAVAFAARQGISTDGGTLYVECAPCLTCAKSLVAAGIRRVVYARTYRDEAGATLLAQALIVLDQLTL